MSSKIIYTVFSKLFLILLTVIMFQSLILINVASTFALGSPAPIQWSKTFGGAGNEVAASMIKTNDGNYVIAGSTTSFGAGDADFWLIKIDANGNLLWNRTYGAASSTNPISATSVIQTNDGGYALGGSNGWLLKLDSSGNVQWNQTKILIDSYGLYVTGIYSIVQTNDGGYGIIGRTNRLPGVPAVIRLDSSGNLQWSKLLGSGSPMPTPTFGPLIHTNDDGFGLVGTERDRNTDRGHFVFMKLDSNGTQMWSISPSLHLFDYDPRASQYSDYSGYCGVQTSDGYTLVGHAYATTYFSNGSNPISYNYLWLIKTDLTGNILWNRTYSDATASSIISSIIKTNDARYALVGTTRFSGNDDFLLSRTDSSGNLLWNKTFGGTGNDKACSVFETNDGGYILGGSTTSYGAGASDFWVVKVPINSQITTSDNYDGLWHTTNVPITLTNSDPANTQSIYYIINDGSTKTVSIDGQPTITSEATNNTLEYWTVDKSSLEEWPHKLITIKIDKTPPTGSIIINNGNISTNSRSVTLTLTYMDTISNVSQVRYSNDGVWDTEIWENATVTKAWNLTVGDATKTVYYQIKDNAGLISQTYFDSVDLRMKNIPSSLSLILDSDTSLIGFKVNLNGKLTSNGMPIGNASILLSYSVTGGQTWNDIAQVLTIPDGTYSAIWQPSATSTYLVRASFAPYFTYNDTQISRMLSVNSFDGQNVFSVASNSSVSALAFNSSSKELSFTVSGETGTTGFVDLSIAKNLVANIFDVKVTLDNVNLNYTATSTSTSWLLHFTYNHSTHNININLASQSPVIPEFSSSLILSLLMIVTLLISVIYFRKHKHAPSESGKHASNFLKLLNFLLQG